MLLNRDWDLEKIHDIHGLLAIAEDYRLRVPLQSADIDFCTRRSESEPFTAQKLTYPRQYHLWLVVWCCSTSNWTGEKDAGDGSGLRY